MALQPVHATVYAVPVPGQRVLEARHRVQIAVDEVEAARDGAAVALDEVEGACDVAAIADNLGALDVCQRQVVLPKHLTTASGLQDERRARRRIRRREHGHRDAGSDARLEESVRRHLSREVDLKLEMLRHRVGTDAARAAGIPHIVKQRLG
eukprot:4761575-Prymnesium_polylepis.1